MTIFALFLVELIVTRYANFGHSHDEEDGRDSQTKHSRHDSSNGYSNLPDILMFQRRSSTHAPVEDHVSHQHSRTDNEELKSSWNDPATRAVDRKTNDNTRLALPESYSAQMTAVAILEFGIIFHSIFIGPLPPPRETTPLHPSPLNPKLTSPRPHPRRFGLRIHHPLHRTRLPPDLRRPSPRHPPRQHPLGQHQSPDALPLGLRLRPLNPNSNRHRSRRTAELSSGQRNDADHERSI